MDSAPAQPVQRAQPSDWDRAHELRRQGERRPLTLPEKQELARVYDRLAEGVAGERRLTTTTERLAIEAMRVQAHRKAEAAVFLSLPPSEGIKQHPTLANAYAFVEASDKNAEKVGLNATQQAQAHELAWQKVAAAIESGRTIPLVSREDKSRDERVRQSVRQQQAAPEQQIHRDRGRDSGRGR